VVVDTLNQFDPTCDYHGADGGMLMPKHMLKLLVLLTVFSVAPATAGHQISIAPPAGLHSKCPHERARAEAAWAAAIRAAAVQRGPTTITLTDRVPADSSLFSVGGESGFLRP
jgi:hypothetical protein